MVQALWRAVRARQRSGPAAWHTSLRSAYEADPGYKRISASVLHREVASLPSRRNIAHQSSGDEDKTPDRTDTKAHASALGVRLSIDQLVV